MTDANAAPQTNSGKRKPTRVGGAAAPAGISWALFEFARNPFYMLIVIYVFPPYFAQYVIGDSVEGQAVVASATKWAGLIGAVTAPILGAMMDRGGARKPLMGVFVAMLIISGVSLWWSLPGSVDAQGVFHPPAAGLGVTGTLLFLVFGFVGYTYSEMMHNAMLRSSGRPESLSQISGNGIGLGQFSSALGLIGVAAIAVLAGTMGTKEGGFVLQRGIGPFAAIWLAVFVAPFFAFMPDGRPEGGTWAGAAKQLFSKDGKLNPVGAILGCFSYIGSLIRAFPETMKFLLAALIYKDGMTALFALAGVYTAGVLGWSVIEGALYGIWASIAGMFGGLVLAGRMDRAFGARRAIIIQLVILCVTVAAALGVTQDSIFYGLIPSGQAIHGGPVFNSLSDVTYLGLITIIAALAAANNSSSRYMMVTLAPKDRLSEFFGLFAMSSTATVWLGPLLTEYATRASGDQRVGFSPVLLLLFIGLLLMLLLKKATGEKGRLAGDTPAH